LPPSARQNRYIIFLAKCKVLKLLDLPGIGSRMRERLLEHYGSEERALEAVSKGDVAGLSMAMSERQALNLVQHARGMKYGVKPEDFLATDEAIRIYLVLISRLAGYAHTEYARLKIGTLFPSSSPELLAENRRLAESALEKARLMHESGIDELLKKIRPLREKAPSRIRERTLAATSARVFGQLKAQGLDRLIDLNLAETPQELRSLVNSYSHVCLVGDDFEALLA